MKYVGKYVNASHGFKKGFKVCVNWLFTSLSPVPVKSVDFLSADVTPEKALEK